jgi:methylthioribose-1-phosphate isomerase
VRAPAIGIAAAMGLVLGVQGTGGDRDAYLVRLREVSQYLRTSRPTAVNLFWALDRMERVAMALPPGAPTAWTERLLAEALAIEEEDRRMCRAIGLCGADLIGEGQGVLTHCNAGGLATADYGTALAVIFAAAEQGRNLHVFADETRPLLQGARLTAWELQQRGVDVTVICDNMAAQVMREGRVNLVVVGADRIAANGDTANKIGTYGVAVLAKRMVCRSTSRAVEHIDLSLPSGDGIPIEQRPAAEVTHGFGKQTAPDGVKVYNPAFDVTPAGLISGIVTERLDPSGERGEHPRCPQEIRPGFLTASRRDATITVFRWQAVEGVSNASNDGTSSAHRTNATACPAPCLLDGGFQIRGDFRGESLRSVFNRPLRVASRRPPDAPHLSTPERFRAVAR